MDPRTDHLLAQLMEGKVAGSAAILIGEIMDALNKEVDLRCLSLVAQNALTPETAMRAWYEKASYEKLRRRLLMRSTRGEMAARQLQPLMDITEGKNGTD